MPFADPLRRSVRELVLVVVTVVWGATFLVTQIGLGDAGPFGLVAARFGIGAITLFVLFRHRMRGLQRSDYHAGLVIGVATFASYAFQTMGLLHIASSRSAFITALYVPAVPILQLVLLGRAPRISAWLGISVSFLGLLILSSGEGLGTRFGLGEALTLGGAVTAALQIVLISRYAPGADPMRIGFTQLAVVALCALVAMPIAGESIPEPTPALLIAVTSLGVLGTAFALGAMNWAQQTVSATRATVIYALEPVWGGLFGALAGELITTSTLIGSGFIVLGVLISSLRPAIFRRAPPSGSSKLEPQTPRGVHSPARKPRRRGLGGPDRTADGD
ncbi:MAG: DMT family transporter [Gemmatimonadota bacterium]